MSPAQNTAHHESSSISLTRISAASEVASLALGKLERQLLEEAWQRAEVSVREIYVAFEERIAYTTPDDDPRSPV